MKVHYDEGVANHVGPEPCAVLREGSGEASAGERAGRPLSRERTHIPGADAVTKRKATRPAASSRAPDRPGVVKDPSMHGRSLHGNREISSLAGGARSRSASGRRGAEADDARATRSQTPP